MLGFKWIHVSKQGPWDPQLWDGQPHLQINGLLQEKRNSIALAMELRLSCINPSK